MAGLLPGRPLAIRERVERALDAPVGVVGELDRVRAMEVRPDLGHRVAVDWVAFGFPGLPFYDAHVGCVFETAGWPVRVHVGLHLRAHLAGRLAGALDAVDWSAAVGREPERDVVEAVGEHRLRDPRRELDLADPAAEADRLAARAVAYWTIARPLLAA
ncbi:MAG: hypothetical protein R3C15_22630 [Thermoleophilia bacterium]